ncbi:MAG: response regulator, partial [Bacteroidia bacterium]|nr:response regulator [Bacteroidia bacterium]
TTASNKGVDLMNYVDSSIPDIVEGDSVRLAQVLINLVNNALKFTDHGEVYFTAELTESSEVTFKVLFKVKDNGIGISEEAQQKIFHSFTQVDSSTTRKYGGTGLGLAISKRLVEMMGGTIGVESVLGEGSLFWFTAKFGVSSQRKQIKVTTKLLIDGLKVLIVDDNRTNRFVFGKYLEIWNCKYDQAENGEIALKMLIENAERNSPYDVALIDYQMEKMDGLKLAEQIQKNSKISSTRLILLSSVTDVIPRSEVARRGFNYFLNKPVKLKELYDVITAVTGNSAGDKLKQAINSEEFTPNLSVLVAEDNPTNLKVAQLILKPFITAFDSAENGLIAFEKFKANKYDVIFMDIQMPVMNGYEAVKSIRDYETENNLTPVKIVAMTANAMKEDVEQCLSSGMNEYLSKPFRRDDMFKIIEKLNLR